MKNRWQDELRRELNRITRGGKTIWYGHDSGIYPDATIQALGDGVPVDVAGDPGFQRLFGPRLSDVMALLQQAAAASDRARWESFVMADAHDGTARGASQQVA